MGENGQLAGLVRDHGFELVIVHFTHVIFETTVQDGAGHFGSVTELGWQATNIAAHAQDVFSEQPEKIKPVNKQLEGVPTSLGYVQNFCEPSELRLQKKCILLQKITF